VLDRDGEEVAAGGEGDVGGYVDCTWAVSVCILLCGDSMGHTIKPSLRSFECFQDSLRRHLRPLNIGRFSVSP
jgi:hypothetical protein